MTWSRIEADYPGWENAGDATDDNEYAWRLYPVDPRSGVDEWYLDASQYTREDAIAWYCKTFWMEPGQVEAELVPADHYHDRG